MRIAFYAPLKSPDHAVPSGDRRMAQLFVAALQCAGHAPLLVSRFRSFEGHGDASRQARLAGLGEAFANRFLRRCRAAPATAPELWFTYHLYHKAPDWLGPRIAAAVGIPYIVAEASFAPKRAGGPWDSGHRAVEAAIRRADAVIGLNPADRDCVLPLLADPARWVAIKPFLDARRYAPRERQPPAGGSARLVVVAMMRPGDKLASYRVLGDALSRLGDLDWQLSVVGDGAARPEIAHALAALGSRVDWVGRIDAAEVARRLAAADICVWPAINEAFGMALLEAQASGLPVVAGNSGGVGEIVASEATGLLVPPADAAAFAAAVRRLILDHGLRARLAAAARRRVLHQHDLPSAARRLGAVIDALRPADAA
jgi:glycosyltransferase involved in cell wall biosynthesis